MTLRYTQVLSRAGDAYRFRYLAGTAAAARAAAHARRGLPVHGDARRSRSRSLPRRAVASPSRSRRRTGCGYRATASVSSVRPDAELRGSVDVFLPLARPTVGHLARDASRGRRGRLLHAHALAGPCAGRRRQPRDVAVVVDTSGSMSGEKIEQARQALHRLLGTLRRADRFRLVAFSNRVEAQRPDWTPATRAAVTEARGWVDRLSATGGTNIAGALDEVFRTPGGDGRLHLVIFITDGLPTVGETDPDRIAARVEATRRRCTHLHVRRRLRSAHLPARADSGGRTRHRRLRRAGRRRRGGGRFAGGEDQPPGARRPVAGWLARAAEGSAAGTAAGSLRG